VVEKKAGAKKQRVEMQAADNSKKRKGTTHNTPAAQTNPGPQEDDKDLLGATIDSKSTQSKRKKAAPVEAASKTAEAASDLVVKEIGAKTEDAPEAPDARIKNLAGAVKNSKTIKPAASGIETDKEVQAFSDNGDEEEQPQAKVGSGRQAAQGKKYKEKGVGRSMAMEDMMVVVEEQECKTEAAALDQTFGAGAKRR
jgi:hypothetical protein